MGERWTLTEQLSAAVDACKSGQEREGTNLCRNCGREDSAVKSQRELGRPHMCAGLAGGEKRTEVMKLGRPSLKLNRGKRSMLLPCEPWPGPRAQEKQGREGAVRKQCSTEAGGQRSLDSERRQRSGAINCR